MKTVRVRGTAQGHHRSVRPATTLNSSPAVSRETQRPGRRDARCPPAAALPSPVPPARGRSAALPAPASCQRGGGSENITVSQAEARGCPPLPPQRCQPIGPQIPRPGSETAPPASADLGSPHCGPSGSHSHTPRSWPGPPGRGAGPRGRFGVTFSASHTTRLLHNWGGGGDWHSAPTLRTLRTRCAARHPRPRSRGSLSP